MSRSTLHLLKVIRAQRRLHLEAERKALVDLQADLEARRKDVEHRLADVEHRLAYYTVTNGPR
jgi:hypothetical protein